jgi:fructan beta-fructosidase
MKPFLISVIRIKTTLTVSVWILLLSLLTASCRDKANKIPVSDYGISRYYMEPYRPQFHFSPEANWMNDPNGMVYLDGEYHLFYQYYPDSIVWGPMHWGHAVSIDLVHWRHLPIALYPDSLGYIFSGSAVFDKNNTSGLGTEKIPPLIAIFTYHNPVLENKGSKTFQNQGIAYSIDKGITWIKYPGNPVLKNPGISDFRDPKVLWHPETGKWIMILAVHDRIHLYSSPNLLNWTFESEFGKGIGAHGGVWECPDLFKLEVEGDTTSKWVMFVSINTGGPNGGSATQYFIGNFDGHKFVPENVKEYWVDWGRDNYAGVTWSNIPESDGRRLFLGWMSNWDYAMVVPTKAWRSAMTIPRELSLKCEDGHYFLTSKPVREIGDLRIPSDTVTVMKQILNGEKEISTGRVALMQSELFFGFDMSDSRVDSMGIILENNLNERFIIGYAADLKQFYIDRRSAGNSGFSKDFAGISRAPYKATAVLKLHLLIDASSVELFVDDGRLVMTTIVFPAERFDKLKLFSKGGNVLLNKAVFHGIKKAWR